MNVFTEWHHGGLYHAQQLLWEKRLGYKLFAPAYINTVKICQEFPLETFYYEEPKKHKTIKNFMNQLNEAKALPIWQGLKDRLPDFEFKMHGSNGDDGMIDGLAALGNAMRDMAFLFQVKHHGEGFGHVIHNSYSVGRPAITMLEFYRGKLAERFLIDDFSAIILDNKSWEQVVEKIRFWSIPVNHLKMCHNARRLFEKYIDFNEDEKRFRVFLERLK